MQHRIPFRAAAAALFGVCVLVFVPGARAQLQADPATVDLGRHRQEKVVETAVKLTNTGPRPLEITGVQADCSCTAAKPEKHGLAPGESTQLALRMETRSYQGMIHRRVVVETSEGPLLIPVDVTVSRYDRWTFAPDPVIFPASQRGKEVNASVELSYAGGEKAAPGRIGVTPAYVDATCTAKDGKTFSLELKKRADAPSGNHSIKVVMETNDPAEPQLTLTVFMPVASALRVTPSPIVLPTVKAGQQSVREVTLLGWDNEALPRLELAQGRAEIRERVGDRIEIEVAVTPSKPGPLTQLLRVYLDHTLEAEVPVVLRAERADEEGKPGK